MSKSKKESKKGFSSLNRVLIIQLIIMLVLSVFITTTVSNRTRTNSIEHMGAITDERAHIIENYISNAEKTLISFSKADQVMDILTDPEDHENMINAQAYTKTFGDDIDNLEGIYISQWDTTVLTHTTTNAVGITTRSGDALEQLRNTLISKGDGVYNAGIIISPATGKQIVSMYKAVYNKSGEPIGLVGLGIYTEGLIQTLDNIPIRGIENSFYSMVNVNDNKYIFNVDKELVGTEVERQDLVDLCDKIKNLDVPESDYFQYKQDGKNYVSIYSYMPENGWLLMIDDSTSEVFALTRTMIIYLGIFVITILGLIIVFNTISKRQAVINEKLASTIAKNNQTRKSLNMAMFKDVLTDVNNRISFSMDIEKLNESEEKKPYYFAMFNVCEFSEINTRFGNDAGDRILVKIVDVLKDVFPDQTIYRTGSDEFVVAIPVDNGNPTEETVLDNVNTAFRQLLVPEDLGNQKTVYPKYKIAVVKRSTNNINSSIVAVLKDMTNKTGEASYGLIDYRDMF